MPDYIFPDSEILWQMVVTTPIVYLLVIAYVRLVGVRSVSQMNSFDWIVTVAMGSITASTIILDGVTLAEGALSIAILLILQMTLTYGNQRFEWMRKLMKATPQLLWYDGEFLEDNMAQARVIRAEVYSAIRSNGYKTIEDVYAVVLETNSTISVIPNENSDTLGFSLADVGGLPEGLQKDLKERGESNDQSQEEQPDDASAEDDHSVNQVDKQDHDHAERRERALAGS